MRVYTISHSLDFSAQTQSLSDISLADFIQGDSWSFPLDLAKKVTGRALWPVLVATHRFE